jgi:hypothetical protein
MALKGISFSLPLPKVVRTSGNFRGKLFSYDLRQQPRSIWTESLMIVLDHPTTGVPTTLRDRLNNSKDRADWPVM